MWRILLLGLVSTASAQIPALGYCPEYLPMANFDINRYLGTWYENVRYFTVSEIASRCVTTRYERTPEGRVMVFNEITNALTGLKRGIDGVLTMAGREGDGFFTVKYSSLPVPYESSFTVLSTDYDNYALLWACSGIGPVHTQNAWIMTRERVPSSLVMQVANAAVDKYKISRTFFVKTNQADCTVLPHPFAESDYRGDPSEGKHAGIISDVADLVKKVVENPYGLQLSVNRDNGTSQFNFNILPQDKISTVPVGVPNYPKPLGLNTRDEVELTTNEAVEPKELKVDMPEKEATNPDKTIEKEEIMTPEEGERKVDKAESPTEKTEKKIDTGTIEKRSDDESIERKPDNYEKLPEVTENIEKELGNVKGKLENNEMVPVKEKSEKI